MTELRRRMIEEFQLRNYSPNTVEIYIRCVARFAQHFKLAPDRLGREHIRQYQLFLVQRKKVAWAVFNQTVCALRFFYHHVLHRDWMIEQLVAVGEIVGGFAPWWMILRKEDLFFRSVKGLPSPSPSFGGRAEMPEDRPTQDGNLVTRVFAGRSFPGRDVLVNVLPT